MTREVIVVCESMRIADYLIHLAIDKVPNALEKRIRNQLITTNGVRYTFVSENEPDKIRGFRGLILDDYVFEKMLTHSICFTEDAE